MRFFCKKLLQDGYPVISRDGEKMYLKYEDDPNIIEYCLTVSRGEYEDTEEYLTDLGSYIAHHKHNYHIWINNIDILGMYDEII